MPLTDQQLRQELLNYGETVPPITQRNREQLRARLDVLRARPRSPIKSPATRARSPASPPRASARSRPSRGLIELSDSETETFTNDHRQSRSPAKKSNVQTRTVGVGRDYNGSYPSPSLNVTADVEKSIARHRVEIQQLMDSAREKTRAASTKITSGHNDPPKSTPLRPATTSSRQHQSSEKSNLEKPKQPSWLNRKGKAIGSFWKNNHKVITDVLKALIFGLLVGGGLILLKTKGGDLIPHRRGITCSRDNATDCDEMIPMMDSLIKFLQTRTGETDCNFRPKKDFRVERSEINKYLDEKGFKFEAGHIERWNTLVTYIRDKPVNEITIWNNQDQQESDVSKAFKLSANEGTHSVLCRARKTFDSLIHHLAWVLLGTTGLLSLGWFLKRRSKQHEESENTYKDFIEKITNLLENQYEEHLNDPQSKPWLAISHVRDMLIPPQDRKRLKALWDRAVKQISQSESRVRSESQLIHGEEFDVWRWIQPRSPSPQRPPRSRSESPHSSTEESYVYMSPDVGLTECLKLRNFFDPDTPADDDEIDLVVDSIQNRCATIRRIEHIGIHAIYVYLKFSSKEAAAQGFHLLNNWKFHGREIIAKYLRLERYHEHFPEARDSSSSK